MEDRVVSYAQNREDVILAAFFDEDEKGFYVDVGANHPINDSVTKYFYERGWTGINIEPNQYQYDLMVKDRKDDINLKIGISNKAGKLKLRVYDKGDGLSTFSEKMKESYESHQTYFTDEFHEDTVEVKTLKQVFEEQKVDTISFLKVDVEGYEYEVLEGNDWDNFKPEVICIEANHIYKDWHPILKKYGYELVFFDGLNEYFVSSAAKDRKDKFSYVKGLIGRPIVSSKWDQVLTELYVQKQRAEQELQASESKLWDAKREVAFLQAELIEQRRIRNLIKTLFRKIDGAIQANIEALNKPKRKHASKHISIKDSSIDKTLTRRELLEIANENDMANFYSTKSSTGSYGKLYSYKASKFIYTNSRLVLKLAFKAIRRVLRKVKRTLA